MTLGFLILPSPSLSLSLLLPTTWLLLPGPSPYFIFIHSSKGVDGRLLGKTASRISRPWAGLGIQQFLEWNSDLGVVVFQLHEDKLRQDLRVLDKPGSFKRSDPGLPVRQVLLEVPVGFIFISKAAHESPASSGDLQGIKCGLLHLR